MNKVEVVREWWETKLWKLSSSKIQCKGRLELETTAEQSRYRDSFGELKMFSVSSDDILILIYVFGRIRMLEANIGV